MTSYWIKLYVELLDDPKIGPLPDWVFRRFIEFLLMAKDYNQNGLLPPVDDMAWRLRLSEQKVSDGLRALEEIGVVKKEETGWLIVNFAKRQMSMGESAVRMAKYRQRRIDAGMPAGYTYSSQEILKRDSYTCVYCGSKDNLCVDHVYPIIHGGNDDTDNLACACKACNSGKSGRTLEESGYKFLNKEAEKRYNHYVTVTSYGNISTSLSDSSSSLPLSLDSDSSFAREGELPF